MNKKSMDAKLVTIITGIDNRKFYLYDNGQIYEKGINQNLIKLNPNSKVDKIIIDKIFNRFRNVKTDVI